MSAFFSEIWMTFQILIATFAILILAFNFNSSWPRYPWDMTIDKFGFRIYIPVITSLGIAILATILLRIINIGPKSSFF